MQLDPCEPGEQSDPSAETHPASALVIWMFRLGRKGSDVISDIKSKVNG